MKKLRKLKSYAIIHYSRSGFNEPIDEVYGLYIYYKDTYKSFTVDDVNYTEEEAIHAFIEDVKSLISNGVTIIHWGQDNDLFGPDHLTNLYHTLTGDSIEFQLGGNAVNLSWEMLKHFGPDYSSHPRLDSIADMNDWGHLKEEFDPCPLFSYKRTSLIVKIFYGLINKTLILKSKLDLIEERRMKVLTEIKDQLKLQNDKVLNRTEVMQLLGVSHTTIAKWVRDGEIPHTRIGRRLYFLQSQILNKRPELYN